MSRNMNFLFSPLITSSLLYSKRFNYQAMWWCCCRHTTTRSCDVFWERQMKTTIRSFGPTKIIQHHDYSKCIDLSELLRTLCPPKWKFRNWDKQMPNICKTSRYCESHIAKTERIWKSNSKIWHWYLFSTTCWGSNVDA